MDKGQIVTCRRCDAEIDTMSTVECPDHMLDCEYCDGSHQAYEIQCVDYGLYLCVHCMHHWNELLRLPGGRTRMSKALFDAEQRECRALEENVVIGDREL